MKTIKIMLPVTTKQISIHPCGDWHIGDPHTDLDLIKARINNIKNDENAYMILNGDILNNAVRHGVSDIYSETGSPMGNLKLVVDLLRPVKHKILGVTGGNHCFRSYKDVGLDLMAIICRELGIEERYSQGAVLIFVRLGQDSAQGPNRQHCYSIYALHGSGGGRKEGAKAIRLADMGSIIDSDVFVHSHTHMPLIMKQDYIRVTPNNSSARQVTRLFVNSSAALNYGGYGESFEFKPASKDNPVIYLSGTKKMATAEL